ncbi:MAG TPA: hypothetical protein VM577_12045 [Anaerovoracaceae bacterium]|nr:hypothetical protein [Anaerovoracaceae bacterium]
MLGKLIKYDIRSTWRDFSGVYMSILLGVLILPPLFNHFNNALVNTVAGFIATAIVIATIVVVVVTIFKIFNTNVFSKQGYLTMTLPVTSSQVVLSKLLVSTMWIVLTGIVSIIGMLIFILNMNTTPLAEISAAFQKLLSVIDSRGVLAIILMVVAMIVSAASAPSGS